MIVMGAGQKLDQSLRQKPEDCTPALWDLLGGSFLTDGFFAAVFFGALLVEPAFVGTALLGTVLRFFLLELFGAVGVIPIYRKSLDKEGWSEVLSLQPSQAFD